MTTKTPDEDVRGKRVDPLVEGSTNRIADETAPQS